MVRLLGNKYNKETDEVTLQSDKCPVKQQNTDYVAYLLTALYYESWVGYYALHIMLAMLASSVFRDGLIIVTHSQISILNP